MQQEVINQVAEPLAVDGAVHGKIVRPHDLVEQLPGKSVTKKQMEDFLCKMRQHTLANAVKPQHVSWSSQKEEV